MSPANISSKAPDISAKAELLVRAFMDDPIAVWVAPSEEHRERALRAYLRMTLRYALNSGGRVDSSGDELRSAAI